MKHLYSPTPAAEFGPLRLKAVRDELLPASAGFNTPEGWPRAVMALMAAGLGVFGPAAVGVQYLVPGYTLETRHPLLGLGMIMLRLFAFGARSTFLYHCLRTVQVRHGGP